MYNIYWYGIGEHLYIRLTIYITVVTQKNFKFTVIIKVRDVPVTFQRSGI